MSDSEDEDGGGLGLEAILWGNIGENDEVEADYLDKVSVQEWAHCIVLCVNSTFTTVAALQGRLMGLHRHELY